MKKTIFLFIAISLFLACNKEKGGFLSSDVKPSAIGSVAEVTVVMPDSLWKAELGDSVFYYLTKPFKGLPQDEATFKVIHLTFNQSKIFKTQRNLIIFIFSDTLKNNINIEENKWANNQIVITIQAKNSKDLFLLWQKNKHQIYRTIFNQEIKRYQLAFRKAQNKEISDSLINRYALNLIFPDDYEIFKLKKNFAWIERNTIKSIQAVFISIYPFYDAKQLLKDSVLLHWNYVLYKNVPGPKEGTYPAIEPLYEPDIEYVLINGQKAHLFRCLWKTEGGFFLGGPCLILNYLDTKHNRIISLFGLIYGGKQNKKLFVWQVEAIMKSLEIK